MKKEGLGLFNEKAQGTIEYLVIIAIVVVISLVVVSLVVNIVGQNSGASGESAKLAWKMATPFSVIDWMMNSTGELTLVLKNNSDKLLYFNFVEVSGMQSSGTFSLPMGSTKNVVVSTGVTGPVGSNYSFLKEEIFFDYNTVHLTNMKQRAPTDLVGMIN